MFVETSPEADDLLDLELEYPSDQEDAIDSKRTPPKFVSLEDNDSDVDELDEQEEEENGEHRSQADALPPPLLPPNLTNGDGMFNFAKILQANGQNPVAIGLVGSKEEPYDVPPPLSTWSVRKTTLRLPDAGVINNPYPTKLGHGGLDSWHEEYRRCIISRSQWDYNLLKGIDSEEEEILSPRLMGFVNRWNQVIEYLDRDVRLWLVRKIPSFFDPRNDMKGGVEVQIPMLDKLFYPDDISQATPETNFFMRFPDYSFTHPFRQLEKRKDIDEYIWAIQKTIWSAKERYHQAYKSARTSSSTPRSDGQITQAIRDAEPRVPPRERRPTSKVIQAQKTPAVQPPITGGSARGRTPGTGALKSQMSERHTRDRNSDSPMSTPLKKPEWNEEWGDLTAPEGFFKFGGSDEVRRKLPQLLTAREAERKKKAREENAAYQAEPELTAMMEVKQQLWAELEDEDRKMWKEMSMREGKEDVEEDPIGYFEFVTRKMSRSIKHLSAPLDMHTFLVSSCEVQGDMRCFSMEIGPSPYKVDFKDSPQAAVYRKVVDTWSEMAGLRFDHDPKEVKVTNMSFQGPLKVAAPTVIPEINFSKESVVGPELAAEMYAWLRGCIEAIYGKVARGLGNLSFAEYCREQKKFFVGFPVDVEGYKLLLTDFRQMPDDVLAVWRDHFIDSFEETPGEKGTAVTSERKAGPFRFLKQDGKIVETTFSAVSGSRGPRKVDTGNANRSSGTRSGDGDGKAKVGPRLSKHGKRLGRPPKLSRQDDRTVVDSTGDAHDTPAPTTSTPAVPWLWKYFEPNRVRPPDQLTSELPRLSQNLSVRRVALPAPGTSGHGNGNKSMRSEISPKGKGEEEEEETGKMCLGDEDGNEDAPSESRAENAESLSRDGESNSVPPNRTSGSCMSGQQTLDLHGSRDEVGDGTRKGERTHDDTPPQRATDGEALTTRISGESGSLSPDKRRKRKQDESGFEDSEKTKKGRHDD